MVQTQLDAPIVTLTTDFGDSDTYVGMLKGVIHSVAPRARVVDLIHSIPPQDIQAAAYHVSVAAPFFPAGSIHVVVVDPGVGTERRALAVETERAIYVAPDNGVLTWVMQKEAVKRMIHLTNRDYWLEDVSSTFHGRDIFSPVAAHLAVGVKLGQLGDAVSDAVRLPVTLVTREADGSIHGQIQHIDHFGNAVTNIPESMVRDESDDPGGVVVWAAGRDMGAIRKTYAEAKPGETLALFGSAGFLEIAVRNANAADRLELSRGDHVKVVMA